MFLHGLFIVRLGMALGTTLLFLTFAVLSTHKATLFLLFLSALMFTNIVLYQPKDAISPSIPEENSLSKKDVSQKLVLLKTALELQPSHQDLLYNTVVLQAIANQNSAENDIEELQNRLQRVSPALVTEL